MEVRRIEPIPEPKPFVPIEMIIRDDDDAKIMWLILCTASADDMRAKAHDIGMVLPKTFGFLPIHNLIKSYMDVYIPRKEVK